MKFVCERCHTKYSIADEKVRGKVLKVRCKTCANVITVRETGATIDDAAGTGPREASISLSGSIGDGKKSVAKPAALPAAALFGPGSPVVPPPPRKAIPSPPPPPPHGRRSTASEWYLAVDGAQTGPFSRSRLCDKILALQKDADVHVWNGDFDAWKAPKDVPELHAELGRRRRSRTPIPPPPPRRISGLSPVAAAPSVQPRVTGATPEGLVTLDVESPLTKLPEPEPKKNGVPPGSGAVMSAGQAAVGGFGLGDLIREGGEVAPTPRPAAPPGAATFRRATAPPPAASSPQAIRRRLAGRRRRGGQRWFFCREPCSAGTAGQVGLCSLGVGDRVVRNRGAVDAPEAEPRHGCRRTFDPEAGSGRFRGIGGKTGQRGSAGGTDGGAGEAR